ncbi:MAG: hypothetical protein ACRC6V_03245 [Bacteroidales bacterium]
MKRNLSNIPTDKILRTPSVICSKSVEDKLSENRAESLAYFKSEVSKLKKEFKSLRAGNSWYMGHFELVESTDEYTLDDIKFIVSRRTVAAKTRFTVHGNVDGLYFTLESKRDTIFNPERPYISTAACICGGYKPLKEIPSCHVLDTKLYFGSNKRNRVIREMRDALRTDGDKILAALIKNATPDDDCAQDLNYALLP